MRLSRTYSKVIAKMIQAYPRKDYHTNLVRKEDIELPFEEDDQVDDYQNAKRFFGFKPSEEVDRFVAISKKEKKLRSNPELKDKIEYYFKVLAQDFAPLSKLPVQHSSRGLQQDLDQDRPRTQEDPRALAERQRREREETQRNRPPVITLSEEDDLLPEELQILGRAKSAFNTIKQNFDRLLTEDVISQTYPVMMNIKTAMQALNVLIKSGKEGWITQKFKNELVKYLSNMGSTTMEGGLHRSEQYHIVNIVENKNEILKKLGHDVSKDPNHRARRSEDFNYSW